MDGEKDAVLPCVDTVTCMFFKFNWYLQLVVNAKNTNWYTFLLI